jgi:hypothetical protein
MSKLFEAKLSRLLGSYWSMVASNSSRMAVNHYEERFKIAMDYVNELEAENARLREAQRWIPVEERLPEVFDISESLEVVYVFVFWSVIQNKEVLSEPRKMAAKYSNAAGWVTNDGRKELRDLRYHVKFWKEFTPFVQPPEEK